MDRNSAYAKLPAGAVWTSSFGYPGEGGFRDHYRAPDGSRIVIGNGSWCDFGANSWTIETIA